jgi:hypothetical protein
MDGIPQVEAALYAQAGFGLTVAGHGTSMNRFGKRQFLFRGVYAKSIFLTKRDARSPPEPDGIRSHEHHSLPCGGGDVDV